MPILFRDKKVTVGEFAKLSVENALDASLYLEMSESYDYMTPKERKQVDSALRKQRGRVLKFLDFDKIKAKLSRKLEVDKSTISKHF